jgi:hypothetical protein
MENIMDELLQCEVAHANNSPVPAGIDPELGTIVRTDRPSCRIFLALNAVRI